MKTEVLTLDKLSVGTKAKVIKLKAEKELRRRLMDMGIIHGTQVKIDGIAPLGDPIEISVLNYKLTLRRSEAALIEVEVV
ncbi:MAG: FeoA family protein [Thermoanaerobacteraceae bacterium]